ncbi:MAG TPA: polyprenyl synthetase family protein, partial [Candidatus Sumerlaeota bacterium]|nr:polyprenyl synthetase family protein [Candidatus Sumerlaeota bacterium]
NFSIEEYFRLVTEKTGYCLGASLIAAAIITDADAATRAALKEYALAIGPLFQIRDDVIDLTEGKGRERLGSDIREGKRSYLVAHVLSRCTSEERNQLLAILDAPRGETGDDDVAWVAGLFHTYGSFESAQKENERLLARAMTAAALMPLELGGLLNDFADLLLKRRK